MLGQRLVGDFKSSVALLGNVFENSLNHYFFTSMNERWSGFEYVYGHSEKNSMILSSSSARMPFTVLRALCISGVCAAVFGSPGR